MSNWGIIPALRVRDMAQALAFYQGVLGFKLERGGPDAEHCSLSCGDARLMLEIAGGFYTPAYNDAIHERLGTRSATALYVESEDLAGLQSRLAEAGVSIIDPLADRPWGQAEVTVEDPEGNWLTFWHALEHGHEH